MSVPGTGGNRSSKTKEDAKQQAARSTREARSEIFVPARVALAQVLLCSGDRHSAEQKSK